MERRAVPTRNITLTGAFVPFYLDNQPVLVVLEGETFLPVFSTVEKLQEQLPIMKPDGPIRIKKIDDGRNFLESVVGRVRVMLDPFPFLGNTRFTEVTL